MTILAFDLPYKNTTSRFGKNMEKNEIKQGIIEISRESFSPDTIPTLKKPEDMALIASWVYQKSPKTQLYYKRVIREFFEFYPSLNLRTTQIAHLVLFLKSFKDFNPSTRNTYKNALRSLFSFAIKTQYLEKNPALALENIKTPDKIFSKVLSREQIQRMIQIEKNDRNKLILKILYFTGLRVDELTSLKCSSFQMMKKLDESNPSKAAKQEMVMIVVGKGRKVRSLHIPVHLKQDIMDYTFQLNHEDYLFTNDRRVDFGINDFTRTKLNNSQIFRIVKQAAKNAGLSVAPSPHWLRHTSATHAIESGAPVHVVQRSLGHESISTTGRYLEIRPKESIGDYIQKVDDAGI